MHAWFCSLLGILQTFVFIKTVSIVHLSPTGHLAFLVQIPKRGTKAGYRHLPPESTPTRRVEAKATTAPGAASETQVATGAALGSAVSASSEDVLGAVAEAAFSVAPVDVAEGKVAPGVALQSAPVAALGNVSEAPLKSRSSHRGHT